MGMLKNSNSLFTDVYFFVISYFSIFLSKASKEHKVAAKLKRGYKKTELKTKYREFKNRLVENMK